MHFQLKNQQTKLIHVTEGKILDVVINLKKNSYETISLGDSENDIPMLELTNFACIIKSNKSKKLSLKNKKIYRSNQTAPDGWKESLEHVLSKEKINF